MCSLRRNFFRVCVSLYNIFVKEMEIIIRKKKAHLQDLYELEKDSGVEIDNIFRSKSISISKKESLSSFVDLLYQMMRTQKNIRDNEKLVDGELTGQLHLTNSEIADKERLLQNLNAE